jgi:hypothetical protein
VSQFKLVMGSRVGAKRRVVIVGYMQCFANQTDTCFFCNEIFNSSCIRRSRGVVFDCFRILCVDFCSP